MDHQKMYTELCRDFSPEIALSVCQINAINLTMKVKKTDSANDSILRTARVIKKAEKLFFLVKIEENDFALIISLWKVVNDWQIGQDMDGKLGSEKRTFIELLNKKG